MTEPATAIVLYRLPPAFGLPSLSVACVQVEAYLRLAKLPFAVQDCTAPSASPTGQVPALDTSADLVGAEVSSAVAAPLAEFGAARQMLDYIEEKMVDLDRHLSVSQRAEATAFTALVEAKLQPAIVYTTWVEADAFSQHTCAAYAGGMPFPLSYFMPRSQRRAVQRHFAATPSAQVYQGAADALDALAIRLSANASATSAGDFFFGSQPSSLDALLYSCLAYLRAAPVVHPQLQRKLAGHRVLTAYCDRVSQLADFDSTVPAAADANLGWSAWGGGTTDDQFSKAKSEQESELQRKGRRWLACAAAAIAAYVFLSGQYYPFSIERFGYYEDLEEEEEEH